ncbi:hypothetical protein O6P37_15940 [Mycobacterium sp. CPCC 205372]|uniref:Lipoprotein n=1 Tax=Mycobacterium hippophais TaxID=3016340 RepID=A0ABT4PUZ5_9MYCO|nr:hypothetical protein [Mycobacterium hippophais]MCZ8380360.1 hypothetical protein [Mycobacterium hippophais]
MALLRAIALGGIVIPLAIACGDSTATRDQGTGGDGSSPVAPAASAVIEQSGFGGDENYLWVTSTVRDVPVGQFATVSFNLYGADGTLLASESQTEQGVNPGARITVGTQVAAPAGQAVTRIEPTLKISEHDPVQRPKFSDVVLQVGPTTLGQNSFGSPTADAILTNPSDQQIPSARVGAICFNPQGTIIGGGYAFPDVIPANGEVKVSSELKTSEPPARCELTAQPSDF